MPSPPASSVLAMRGVGGGSRMGRLAPRNCGRGFLQGIAVEEGEQAVWHPGRSQLPLLLLILLLSPLPVLREPARKGMIGFCQRKARAQDKYTLPRQGGLVSGAAISSTPASQSKCHQSLSAEADVRQTILTLLQSVRQLQGVLLIFQHMYRMPENETLQGMHCAFT